METKVVYLPVVNRGIQEKYKFWTGKSYFYYPNMLVSPYVTGLDVTREDFGKNASKLNIYADSGGFQIVTMNKRVDPFEILRWQEKIANVAFTVDFPPHTISKNYSSKDFLKKEFHPVYSERSER